MAWKIGLWITRIVAIVVIAALLSIWTTGYVVTSYVSALLKQYEIPIEVEPMALSDVWSMIWGTNKSAAIAANTPDDRQQQDQIDKVDHDDIRQGQVSGEIDGTDERTDIEQSDTEQLDELTEGTTGQQEEEDIWEQDTLDVLAPVETGGQSTITPEDIDASKELLATEDKERLFELLMLKLPSESWQMFSTYIEDGLTERELTDIQQVMAQHLSKEEYEELMVILKKY